MTRAITHSTAESTRSTISFDARGRRRLLCAYLTGLAGGGVEGWRERRRGGAEEPRAKSQAGPATAPRILPCPSDMHGILFSFSLLATMTYRLQNCDGSCEWISWMDRYTMVSPCPTGGPA